MKWRTVLFVLCAVPSLLRGELRPIRAYTTADGLAADRVKRIVADSRGFLWFCTPEGLSRFDGYHFVTYGVREGLAGRAVSSLVVTRAGEYLVGTARGVSRINPAGQGAWFATFAPEPEDSKNSVADLVNARSGKVWCATRGSLFEWNAASGFRRRQVSLPPKVEINSIVESPDGDLWIGTAVGMFLLPRERDRADACRERRPARELGRRDVDRLQRPVVGCASRRAGTDQPGRDRRVGRGEGSDRKIRSRRLGREGRAWKRPTEPSGWARPWESAGSDWRAGEPVVLQNLTRAQGLSDRHITALAEDQAGNIWAGTEGAGVMRIDRVGFTTYREQDGLPTDRVFSVFEDQAGELLAVTEGTVEKTHSLDIFDGAGFHDVTPKPYRERGTWGWNQVLLQSHTGEWWAATKDGLCRYPAMNAVELQGRAPRTCYARDDVVFRIFEDSRGGIWASAQSPRGDELMRWDPRTNTVFQFPAPKPPGGPAGELVSAFAEDRQGNIWMGLYTGGLDRYDGRSFRYFGLEDGVPGGGIHALLAREDGLWIGSQGGGLGHVANPADEHLRTERYDTGRGMASDTIECIVEDRQGRIYAGTAKGVDRLDPKTGSIRHLSSGLAHGEFTSAVRDRSGSLWFATKQGLSRLNPAEDRPPVDPRILITDLRVGGVPYPLSQLGEKWVSQLELRPSQNELQVEFVGLDYEPGEVLRYSYKLDGADSGWSPPRSQLAVNYAALAAGKYRFMVKALTPEGVESTSPAGIDLTVLPEVWRRWWFQVLAVLLAAALAFGVHRYRLTQMMNLERMRTAIATDLHDDIGASLSQIAVLSEVARAGVKGESGRTQESLQRVAALAREMVDSLGDIVWSIRAVPDSLDSLVSRMREFGLDLLAGQGIDFELVSPPAGQGGPTLSLQARRHVFLVFKECLHNASRHSGCTAVKAELRVLEGEVLLTVADNGRGLKALGEPAGPGGGNGIPGMRRRAEILGGSLQLPFDAWRRLHGFPATSVAARLPCQPRRLSWQALLVRVGRRPSAVHYSEVFVTEHQLSESVIGVAIIEDQRELRDGLAFLINSTPPFECKHAYGSMEDALAEIGVEPPRVALVDIGLPGMSGIDGVRILRERHPSIAAVHAHGVQG